MHNTASDTELMVTAYKQLYEIETTLRNIIKNRLTSDYGENWFCIAPMKHMKRFIKPIDSTNLHELLNFFNIYPSLKNIFTTKEKAYLSHLPSIRNKIAHCHKLDLQEATILSNLHRLIISVQ
ncbi:Swt1 family HEPN domain-containing protein [Oceanobacillus jordanicus]|uniref:Swt1-like HEPN domain-containing protein n=1 Tax=Oceanobacillus jordanicus TaxID=2867266 RepID=A0AAW5B1P8_9BACI|nr:Swt1 family HEPN domain-containing protein [Oceanobacillus jordanicus]MCG3417558.1 hypothetical protein [Oceanobacillus jordanicus]